MIVGSRSGHRPSSFVDQVYGQIFGRIMTGHFPVGARLPSEAALSTTFKVSRPVVRDALMRLQRDGLVESRKGSGSYVLRTPPPDIGTITDLDRIARFQRYQEFRIAMEGASARLAAERRTESAIAQIETAHERFCAEIRRGEFRWESDRAFHLAIADASGNEFFGRSLEGPEMSLSDFMSVSLTLTSARSAERGERVITEHGAIVAAIRDRDPMAARIGMEHHLLQSRKRMMDASLAP